MTESAPTNGTQESASGKVTRKITQVPENLKGIFNLQDKELLEIATPGPQGHQNKMLVYGGSGGGIDFADLRNLLKKECQLEISLNADFPKEEAGKARLLSGQESPDQSPPALPIGEALARFKEALGQEKTALESLKEMKPSAEKFAQEVLNKNVYGKLPKIMIDNVQIGRDLDSRGANDYDCYGSDKTFFNRTRLQEENAWPLIRTIYQGKDKFPELINSHIVSIAPSKPDVVNSILTIYLFQDRKAPDSRGYYTPAFVQVKLPAETTIRFISEISKNPDLLEDFYQRVFIGLDSKEGYPGMRRVKADGFYLITDKNLEEVRKAYAYYDPMTGSDQDKRIRTFFQNLGKHYYQNGPYGTGESLGVGQKELTFPVAKGMEELAGKIKDGAVTAEDLTRIIGSWAGHRGILEANPQVRNDLAEIFCKFGKLKYYGHSQSFTYHPVPMLANGVKKEAIISVLEKGINASPEVWGNLLDYYDSQHHSEGTKIDRETELNFYKYATIIEAGLYTEEDPRPIFKKALEENMLPDQKDLLIHSMIVRLGYDNSDTLIGGLRDWDQSRLFNLREVIVKAVVNSTKSLTELNEMSPQEFLLNDVPEIKAIAERWREKGNTDEDVLAAIKKGVPFASGREKEVGFLQAFSEILIPDKLPSAAKKVVDTSKEKERFAETDGARQVFLESIKDPARKQKMNEIFSKIVFHNNQLTLEDMDLWAEQNEYAKQVFLFWHDSKNIVREFSASVAEKALLSKENLAKFRHIIVDLDAAKNGRARTALLAEFIYKPPQNDKDVRALSDFADIIKQEAPRLKTYAEYIGIRRSLEYGAGKQALLEELRKITPQ